MIALTDTLAEATALVAQIDAARGYPKPGTHTHAVPQAHPSVAQWAVPLDGLSPSLVVALTDGLEMVERLPDDWFPGGYP